MNSTHPLAQRLAQAVDGHPLQADQPTGAPLMYMPDVEEPVPWVGRGKLISSLRLQLEGDTGQINARITRNGPAMARYSKPFGLVSL